MRWSGAVLIVTLVGLVCSPAAGAGRGDPTRAITAADQSRAKAMLLRLSDLPSGFTVFPWYLKPTDYAYCAALDESDLTITGEATSRSFDRNVRPEQGLVFTVRSQARVFRSAVDANASWRRRTSPAGEACFRKVLSASMLNAGAVLRSFRRIPFPNVAPRTVAYGVETTFLGSNGRQISLPYRFVLMQRDRAQVMLRRVGRAPDSAAALGPIAQALSRRVTKAME